jgi:hypothetical protein
MITGLDLLSDVLTPPASHVDYALHNRLEIAAIFVRSHS